MFKFIVGLLVGLFLGVNYGTPATTETVPVVYQEEVRPEKAALKLGEKLNCAKKTYTLRERIWTWSCLSKNKSRAYSLVHPDFAFDLLVAGDECPSSQRLWFVSAPNNWVVGAASRQEVGTRNLALEIKARTGGLVFYACR